MKLTTLDDLVKEQSLPRVDVIKMDIQGAESLAFEGMQEVFRANPNLIILVEFWPWGLAQAGSDPAKILQDIRAREFHIYELDGDRRRVLPVHDDNVLLGRNLERHHTNLLLWRGNDLPPGI